MICKCFEYFRNYCKWDGKGDIAHDEEVKVKDAIAKAHALGKPIRFWGGPDSVKAWTAFIDLGTDYLNTDNVERCVEFVRSRDGE